MGRRLSVFMLVLAALLAGRADPTWGAFLVLHMDGGSATFNAEVGQMVQGEILIDAPGEEITGLAFYISYDPEVFRPVEQGELGGPFIQGTWLGGIALSNQVEVRDGLGWLSYTEAAGVSRASATGLGIVARFVMEVVGRPQGVSTAIRLETRNYDRSAHYLRLDQPGAEQRFEEPLRAVEGQVSGFRFRPLPDLALVEGEALDAFDLDDFLLPGTGQVIWTYSRIEAISTRIALETNRVELVAGANQVGTYQLVFTAFEVAGGLTAMDTIDVRIMARPHLLGFPERFSFAEDSIGRGLTLDPWVEDLDHTPEELQWRAVPGPTLAVALDPQTREVLFFSPLDWFGSESVVFVVEDGDGLRDSVSVLVEVTPVNDPPQALRPAPVFLKIGAADPVVVPWQDLVEDVDDESDLLDYQLEVEGGVSALVEGAGLRLIGQIEGRAVVRYLARDSAGESTQGQLVVFVLPANYAAPPVIGPLPHLRLAAGQGMSLGLKRYVADDDPFEALVWAADPGAGLSAVVEAGVLQVEADLGASGLVSIELSATDSDDLRSVANLVVEVIEEDVPLILVPSPLRVVVGEPALFQLDEWVLNSSDTLDWTFTPSAGLDAKWDKTDNTLVLSAEPSALGLADLLVAVRASQGLEDEVSALVQVAAPGAPTPLAQPVGLSLESPADTLRLDLDELAIDDRDQQRELDWFVATEPDIGHHLDPVGRELALFRDDEAGTGAPTSQVVLRVRDTDGLETSSLVQVDLPAVFALAPLPTLVIYSDQTDSSLVLNDYVQARSPDLQVVWTAEPAVNLGIEINPLDSRVQMRSQSPDYVGVDTVRFVGTDQTKRSRRALLEVKVISRGLPPQVSDFPLVELSDDQGVSFTLDDYVVDDDPDEVLVWSVGGPAQLQFHIDPETRVLTIDPAGAEPGQYALNLLVRDPAGNIGIGSIDVVVQRGGIAPRVGPFPQILLDAGAPEEQIGLDPYVEDPDTADEVLLWTVKAEAGVNARVEERQFFVSVPTGQMGFRSVVLRATDLEGNWDEAELRVLIVEDSRAPNLDLEIGLHPVFSDVLDLVVCADEPLAEPPVIQVDEAELEVALRSDGKYHATYQVPDLEGEQLLNLVVEARDRAGNQGRDQIRLALRWMVTQGGSLASPDRKVVLNVPDLVAGPGMLAMIYQLKEKKNPPGAEENPVYSIELNRGRLLEHAVTLQFATGEGIDGNQGILTWDETADRWQELQTVFSETNGWLSVSTYHFSLFRTGEVSSENRLAIPALTNYPNPLTEANGTTQIVYHLLGPTTIRLHVFNALGQRVRKLVDGEFRQAGVWSAVWDGRDRQGKPLGNGIYYYRLDGAGLPRHGSLVLMR